MICILSPISKNWASSLCCCSLGYDQDSIAEAVAAQLKELPYYNSFFQCAHPPVIELASREHNLLLITDEVICGFGRLGQWFGADYFSVKADLMPFAKAVTNGYQLLDGVLVSDRCADVLKADGGEFAHGYTYSGYPAACATGIATLKILQEQDMVTRVREDMSPYLQSRCGENASRISAEQTNSCPRRRAGR